MRVFILFFGCLLAVSCNKKTVDDQSAQRYFIIGEGGGVSGKYDEYKVMESGDIFYMDFDEKKYKKATTLGASATKKIWDAFDALKWPEVTMEPRAGNYNYYIKTEDAGGLSTMQWTDEFQLKPFHPFYKMASKLIRETR